MGRPTAYICLGGLLCDSPSPLRSRSQRWLDCFSRVTWTEMFNGERELCMHTQSFLLAFRFAPRGAGGISQIFQDHLAQEFW